MAQKSGMATPTGMPLSAAELCLVPITAMTVTTQKVIRAREYVYLAASKMLFPQPCSTDDSTTSSSYSLSMAVSACSADLIISTWSND